MPDPVDEFLSRLRHLRQVDRRASPEEPRRGDQRRFVETLWQRPWRGLARWLAKGRSHRPRPRRDCHRCDRRTWEL